MGDFDFSPEILLQVLIILPVMLLIYFQIKHFNIDPKVY